MSKLFIVRYYDTATNEKVEYEHGNRQHAIDTYKMLARQSRIGNLQIVIYDMETKMEQLLVSKTIPQHIAYYTAKANQHSNQRLNWLKRLPCIKKPNPYRHQRLRSYKEALHDRIRRSEDDRVEIQGFDEEGRK